MEFWLESDEVYELTFEEFADSVEPRPSQKRLKHFVENDGGDGRTNGKGV